MKHLASILFILIIVSKVFGQVQTSFGFEEGVIIKKDSTSIKCFVEFAVTYDSRVAYKTTQEGKELLLKSGEIKSIQTPYKYIENITLDNKERLMAMASDGKVKLFSYVTMSPGKTQQEQGASYSFHRAPIIVYALKKESNYYELKKKDFKTKLSELLNDQPSIVHRINSDEFSFEEVDKIINEYNNAHKIIALRRQITAKVVDSETKKSIKDAKVTVQGTDIVTTTNILGFMQVTIDTIDTLLIEHPEYELGLIKVPDVNNFLITLTPMTSRRE